MQLTMTSQISNEILCPICGSPIPERPKGSRHGSQPKTCSEKCRKERARRRERERYHIAKHTEEWRNTRQRYLEKLRERLRNDQEYYAIFRAEARNALRKWRENIRSEHPERHAALKAEKRKAWAEWYKKLLSDPVAWEAHRAKCRAWYKSLTAEERKRIYYAHVKQGSTDE